MSDLFGATGQQLLARVELTSAVRARVNSALRLIEDLDFEVEVFTRLSGNRLREDPATGRSNRSPESGPQLYSGRVKERIDVLTAGTTNPHLNVVEVKRFLLPLPSYAE